MSDNEFPKYAEDLEEKIPKSKKTKSTKKEPVAMVQNDSNSDSDDEILERVKKHVYLTG
jgi:hypothetical protein